MRKKTFLLGICTILASALLVSCKPALEKGEVSSDSFTASMIANVRPVDTLEVQANVQEGSGVLLSWSSVSRAGSYTVSRSDGLTGEDWTVLTTIAPEETSYTDGTAMTGREYHYKVEASCEYSNTDRFAYDTDQMPDVLSADCSIYTGVGAAYWSQEITKKEQIALGSITLAYYFGGSEEDGVEPEGVEIYRSTSGENYTLLKKGRVEDFSTKKSDFGKTYVDETVEQGKTYYYQVRAYAVVDGQKIYGKKSTPLKLTAAEPEGKYSLRVAREPSAYAQHMIVVLTSTAKKNGTLTLSVKDLENKISYQYQEAEDDDTDTDEADAEKKKGKTSKKPAVQAVSMKVSRISTDGRYYSSLTEDIVLKPEQSVYLYLEPTDSTSQLASSLTLKQAALYIPARYNEGKHTLKLDLKKATAVLTDSVAWKKRK